MEWLKIVGASKAFEMLKRLRQPFMSRTLLEKVLMIISLLLFISFISVLLVTRNSEDDIEKDVVCGSDCLKHGGAEDEPAICTTVSCMKHANYMLEKLKPSVDPCNDFYEFACGSYKRHHTLSGRRRTHKVEDDVESEMYGIIRSILTSRVHHRSVSYKYAKEFYKCCMEGTDDFDGMSELILQILKTSDISWSSALSDKAWKKAVVKMILYDSFPFYYISLDVVDDTVKVMLSKAKRGTKRTFLSEEAYSLSTGECRQMQMDYMDLIGSTMLFTEKALMSEKHEGENCTNLHETAVNLFKVEHKLATEEIRCHRPKPLSMLQLRNMAPCSSLNDQTEWAAAFVDEVVPSSRHGHKLIVGCDCMTYIMTIEDVLKSDKTFRYYVLWRHLARYLPLVSSSFRHSYMRLYEALNPLDKDAATGRETRFFSEKWKQCVHLANKAYGLIVAHIYKKEGYHEVDNEEIIELADSILKTYGEMFAFQRFVDNETAKNYLEKLEDLVLDVNYPEIILDEFNLDAFYLENIDGDKHRCNPVMQVEHPKSCFLYSLLRNECIKTKNDLLNIWYEKLNGSSFADIPPISSRVYVDFKRNILTIPAGALRFPYYSHGFYKFAKYGGISTLVILELSRRIREELLREAKQLDLIETSEKECLRHQYIDSWGNEKESQRNLERNWEEVILDNVALTVAYELYKRDFENELDEPILPNVEYNSNQLFFIKYAQMYCEIRNNTYSVFDTSIPAKFRVNNAMMNSKEFSDVFECPKESPMNPIDKCRIWDVRFP